MNGEIPSVPITTLAGVASLTNLLPQLPLPSPLAHTMNNKSLLYHPKVAEEARRILAHQDDGLVHQLSQALRQSSTEHIELKDNMAGDSIEGELPDLLKAILAKDPDVFKAGNSCQNTQEHSAVNNRSGNGSQPFNQQNQHPSPYQAGQVSPCPPGSPARFPHTGGSPSQFGPNSSFHQPQQGTSSMHQASVKQAAAKQASASANKFQQQFLSFATGGGGDASGSKDIPTLNGGLSGNGSNVSPPQRRSRSATVSSPMQAVAAPSSSDSSSRRHHSNHSKHTDHHRSDDGDHSRRRSSSRSAEPVVLLEPLSNESSSHNLNVQMPTVKLTRIDSIPQSELDAKMKKRMASAGSEKLSSRLHRSDRDRKGRKRHRSGSEEEWTETNSHDKNYNRSLSERVKRRRRVVNAYIEDSDDDVQMIEDDDEEYREDSPEPETRKKKKVPTATLR